MSKRKALTVTTLGLGLSLLALGFLASTRSAEAQPGCSSRHATGWPSLDMCGGLASDCVIVTCPLY
jgi:hypothetical protein